MKLIVISIFLFLPLVSKASFLEVPSVNDGAEAIFVNLKEKIDTLKRDNAYEATRNKATFNDIEGCRNNQLVITALRKDRSLQIDSFCNQTEDSFTITTKSDSPTLKLPLLSVLNFKWVKGESYFSFTSDQPYRKLTKETANPSSKLKLEYSDKNFDFNISINETVKEHSKLMSYEVYENFYRISTLKYLETRSIVKGLKNYQYSVSGKPVSHKAFIDSYKETIGLFLQFFI